MKARISKWWAMTAIFGVPALGSGLAVAEDPGRNFIANPGEPHAVVTGAVDRPVQQLFAVDIVEVDGRKVGQRRDGLSLKPGTYTITTANARVDTRLTGNEVWTRRGEQPEMSIELTLEPGYTYYIALDTSARARDNWEVRQWRTEQH